MKQDDKRKLTSLLEAMYQQYGFDFRHYALPSIFRRVRHRMMAERISDIAVYEQKIRRDAEATARLIDAFSLQVTMMFRDPGFFAAFRRRVVPELRGLPFIRIWHAGCSTGEEAYSMAILLAEEGLQHKTRIYATDMNEQAIARARQGKVKLDKMQAYTKNYMLSGGTNPFSDYYRIEENEAIFDKSLLSQILFTPHNLVSDRSFNEFHVIVCRNVMIYFDHYLQQRVHSLFYESLCRGGFLGLGSRESLMTSAYSELYCEVDRGERIYRKKEEEWLC